MNLKLYEAEGKKNNIFKFQVGSQQPHSILSGTTYEWLKAVQFIIIKRFTFSLWSLISFWLVISSILFSEFSLIN
jgi:hypothetical protein